MSEIVALWDLSIAGHDVTSDVISDVRKIEFTDNLHGQADEISVELSDPTGKWRGAWCPDPSDVAVLNYGTAQLGKVFAGEFELDEPRCKIARGGDTVDLRGLAAPVTKALRTEASATFEEMSVEDIIRQSAGAAGLSVQGAFNDLTMKVRRQRRETALAFAVRMAEDTDHYAAIRGETLQFWKVDDIDGGSAVKTFEVDTEGVIGFTGSLESSSTRSSAKVTFLHEDTKEKIEGAVEDGDVLNGDILRVVQRVDSPSHAELLAKSRLHHGDGDGHAGNRRKRNGRLTVSGDPYMVAGIVIELGGSFGKWAGRYVVDSSRHVLHPGPYLTHLNLKAARA